MEKIQPLDFKKFLFKNDDKLKAYCIDIVNNLELTMNFIGYRSKCQIGVGRLTSSIQQLIDESDYPDHFSDISYQFEIMGFRKEDIFNVYMEVEDSKPNIYMRFSIGSIKQEEIYLGLEPIENNFEKAEVILNKYLNQTGRNAL